MDNLAHALAGAVLAESGLKRRTALATATLIIGANFPDVDVLAIPFGEELTFRRGWTHGVLALVVLPFVLTAIMTGWNRFFRRKGEGDDARPFLRREILLLSFIGILSHPALDWLNTYGLRWLMPFDGTWFYGDALFIVDPWLWLILLSGFVVARRRNSIRLGRIALGAAAAYMLLMLGGSLFGKHLIIRGIDEFGISPREVMVGPVAMNPNRRQVVMVEDDAYLLGTLDFLPRPRLRVAEIMVPLGWEHPAVSLIGNEPEAARFLSWSRYPFFQVTGSDTSFTVTMDDARYSDGRSRSWAAVTVQVQPPRMRPEFQLQGVETAMLSAP